MSWTIDATGWTRQLTPPILDGNFTSSLRPSIESVVAMSLGLTTPGRLGFFIDYSELSDSGTHTFYVCRTHGSTGAVGVTYTTGGDTHTTTTGSITWADGEMDIKSFTVNVSAGDLTTHQTTNGLGEHRIWALLSAPTGGGVLHFGAEHTRAYGVIDNNVLASDANAVFYDSAAVSAGTGTQADPYDSIYTAIANVGSKRYLYGKGTTIPDSTNSLSPNGGTGILDCIILPVGRTGETDRMFIRNWGVNTWTITGGAATNKIGFYSDGGVNNNISNYIVFKGIDFLDLDCSGELISEGGGIGYFKNGGVGINVEQCTFTNIGGSTNTSGFNAYSVDGAKVWRCTADNIQVNGLISNENSGGVMLTFDGKNLSVQRSESRNSANLIYHKRVGAEFDVTSSVRFCRSTGNGFGVHYGRSGISGVPHSYSIVQCNIFKNNKFAIYHETGNLGDNGSNNAEKHWWCNNVMDTKGGGEDGPIQFRQAYKAVIFNNIYLDCRRLWRENQDSSAFGAVMEYADHELHFGTTLPSQTYEYQAIDYANAALLQAVRPDFAVNDVIANPLFADPSIDDYTLQAGSPALTGGVSGTQQGVYLGNFYAIGAN